MKQRNNKIDLVLLRKLIEVDKLQQHKAAKILDCSVSAVERWCKRLGLQTQKVGSRSGEQHQFWAGGRRDIGGYWYIYAPNHPYTTQHKVVAEHRLVMESVLKRYLLPSEVVHHKNGDPKDNRPENLEVFATNAEHLRHELTGKCPQWTPEGRERISKGARQKRTRPASKELCDFRRTQIRGRKRDKFGRLVPKA